MHKIDPSFSQKRSEARRAGRQRLIRGIAGLLVVGICAAGGVFAYLNVAPPPPAEIPDDVEMVQVEEAADPDAPTYQSDIIDLAGDPLRITLPEESESKAKLRYYVAPRVLARYGVTGNIGFFHDRILPSGSELMVTLPSSQRDFAFYQSQKVDAGEATRVASEMMSAEQAVVEQPTGDPEMPDAAVETVSTDEAAIAVEAEADFAGTDEQWKKGTIENNISSGSLIPEKSRAKQVDDQFLRIKGNPALVDFLVEHKVNPVVAKMAGDAMARSFSVSRLAEGSVLALRFQRSDGLSSRQRLVQMALYAPGKYIGAIAMSSESTGFIDAADPWLDKDLSSVGNERTENSPSQRYRLIDGIYSAAIRNGMQSNVAGEAIMQLSRHFDLAEFATEADSITVVFSVKPREYEGNRTNIMYVAIDRESKSLRCFVTRRQETKDFGCYDEQKSSSVPLLNGEMYKPVEGVMTSVFGMRKHPILGKITLHAGVDWAAPVGTPVRAAYNGTVSFVGTQGAAGNVILLTHPENRSTRYLHLSGFAKNLKVGMTVRAGDLIGYVGTTGRSTGPHLHFELYVNRKAVNPLQIRVADSGNTEAVNALVNTIIHVESGGDAHAKNPKSTATGLGQFIESTWLHMMRTYKPDLVAKYSRSELLALRTDPTLATEMVSNLARESEHYLRSRGHQITPARLYLAHFLGHVGADQILSSPEDASVANIVGANVIKANSFLTGMKVADINRWTEKVMSKRPRKSRVEEKPKEMARELPPEYKEYKRHLDRIVQLATSVVK